MTLSQSFRELLQSFNAERVRYLVIGGYAVAIHGYPRMTKDLDLWVEPTEENADAIAYALSAYGYVATPVIRMQLRSPSQIVVINELPNRIDLLTGVGDFDFCQCFSRRKIQVCDNIELPVVSLMDLRALKAAAGRFQDLADLENLPQE